MNVYTPNSQRDLARLPLRLEWEDRLALYLKELDCKKPIVYCGDLNVAHTDIDLKMRSLMLVIQVLHMKNVKNDGAIGKWFCRFIPLHESRYNRSLYMVVLYE